ncbi:LOW QUALITY PROTEIN: hypothetical protein V1478_015621 [Vespula squamosa]|uniref:Odorant receptor n=1 Tax=Vespula squamosa TaxID=30214 RepID=A0ABD2A1C7_VESSQ
MSFQFESVRYSTLLTSVENNHLLPYLQTLTYFQAVDNIFLKREAMYERSIDSIIKSVGFVTHLEIEYGRLFTMSIIGMSYYDKHFFFSNRLVKLLIGLKPSQSANKQLLLFCLITVYIFPMIAQQISARFYYFLGRNSSDQTYTCVLIFPKSLIYYCMEFLSNKCFYQVYTSDVTLHSTIKLIDVLCNLFSLISYGFICLNFKTVRMIYFTLNVRLIYAHFKFDYVQISDENELKIFKKYTKQTKIYAYIFLVTLNLYFIVIISPCIFNLFLYMFGSLDKIHLKLPFPINGVSSPGPLYYSLFIYQTITFYIFITISIVCYTLFLISIQHVCCQLSILKYVFNVETKLKIRQPFLNKKYNQITWLNKKEEEFDWIVGIIIRHRRIMELVQNSFFNERTKKLGILISDTFLFLYLMITIFIYLFVRAICMLIDSVNNMTKVFFLICTFFGMILIILDFLGIFQLATLMRNTSDLIECSINIVGSLIGVYINFYMGQALINHSNAAFEEFCQIPFYVLSIKIQMLLLFIIARSRKQCALSIGGIFVASNEVFLGLLRKALSLAMVYYNIH